MLGRWHLDRSTRQRKARALELAGDSASGLVASGELLPLQGAPAEGIEALLRAVRPNPSRAAALGRFEAAVGAAERALGQGVADIGAPRIPVASQVELGPLDQARGTAALLLRVWPDFRISLLEQIVPYQPVLIPRFSAGLRRAGLSE